MPLDDPRRDRDNGARLDLLVTHGDSLGSITRQKGNRGIKAQRLAKYIAGKVEPLHIGETRRPAIEDFDRFTMESLLDVVLAGEDKERPGESARRSLVPGKEQHRNLFAEL